MKPLEDIIAAAKASPRRSVLADGEDRRIVEAAVRAQADGLARTVLVGETPRSPLEGAANVMIFANLEAANIGYKIAQRTGGAMTVLFLVVSMTMMNLVF